MPSVNTITTIICAYNAERFIHETLRSVEYQTRLPDEVIIVDDGSTDNTPEILQSFKKGSLLPITIIRKPNEGQNPARIDGFKASSGDFVHWMDADDLLDSKFYHHVEKSFENDSKIGVVYSPHQFINAAGAHIQHSTPKIKRALLTRFWIKNIPKSNPFLSTVAAYCWSEAIEPMCVFRRKAYEETQGWHPKLGTPQLLLGEGALLLTEVSMRYSILRLDQCLYHYRIHSNQATKQGNVHEYARKYLPQIYRDNPTFQTPESARLIWFCELTWKYRLQASKRMEALKHNLRHHFFKAVLDALFIVIEYILSFPIIFASTQSLELLNQTKIGKKEV